MKPAVNEIISCMDTNNRNNVTVTNTTHLVDTNSITVCSKLSNWFILPFALLSSGYKLPLADYCYNRTISNIYWAAVLGQEYIHEPSTYFKQGLASMSMTYQNCHLLSLLLFYDLSMRVILCSRLIVHAAIGLLSMRIPDASNAQWWIIDPIWENTWRNAFVFQHLVAMKRNFSKNNCARDQCTVNLNLHIHGLWIETAKYLYPNKLGRYHRNMCGL